MSQKGELTVGIEWEFLIPQGTSPEDPHDSDERFFLRHDWNNDRTMFHRLPGLLHDVIHQHLEDVVPVVHRVPRNYDAVSNHWDISREPGRPYCQYFWEVTSDCSLVAVDGEDVPGEYRYIPASGVEIKSRVLTLGDLSEIETVYTRVRDVFRVHVNSSCSLHVHIGTPNWSLTRYKKLVTLVMVGEAFLFELCEIHRETSTYCRSIVAASRFNENLSLQRSPKAEVIAVTDLLPEGVPEHVVQTLKEAWATNSWQTLRDGLLTWGGERAGFALRGGETTYDAFYEPRGENYADTDRTVEFRYSHSSGDPVRDQAWIRVCAGLVQAASFDDQAFRAVLQSFVASEELENFLRPLGLANDIAFWEQKSDEYLSKALNRQPPDGFLPRIPREEMLD